MTHARITARPVLAFLGHHRCATSWIGDIFGGACRELGLRYAVLHNARHAGGDVRRFVDERDLDALLYTNAEYGQVASIPGLRAFHVVRDPRDITVSAYFSHLYSHRIDAEWPELAERRARLQRLGKEEGIAAEIDELDWEFACLRQWDYGDPRILEIRMEELTGRPYEEFIRIFRFLDLLDERRFVLARRAFYPLTKGVRVLEGLLGMRMPVRLGPRRLPVERVLGLVWENAFQSKANGRDPGTEDHANHYRKGIAGDWRNHFSPAHAAVFRARHGELLVDLGYEADTAWR